MTAARLTSGDDQRPARRAGPLAILAAQLAALAVAAGCGGPAVRAARDPLPQRFADTRYPLPETPDPGPPQAPPAPPDEPPEPFDTRIGPGPSQPPDEYRRSLQNAAVRDEEHHRLVQGYFALVETLYRVSMARSNSAEAYDPLPMMRFHGELATELSGQLVRAQGLTSAWTAAAEAAKVPLAGSLDEPGVPGRVRLFVQLSSCAADDLEARIAHGQRWVDAQRNHTSDAQLRTAPPPAQQFAQDMLLLKRTLDCSKLVARVLRRH